MTNYKHLIMTFNLHGNLVVLQESKDVSISPIHLSQLIHLSIKGSITSCYQLKVVSAEKLINNPPQYFFHPFLLAFTELFEELRCVPPQ